MPTQAGGAARIASHTPQLTPCPGYTDAERAFRTQAACACCRARRRRRDRPVRVGAGDTISTEARVADIHEKDGRGYYVFESVSKNQEGQEVVRGTWTNIVRGV